MNDRLGFIREADQEPAEATWVRTYALDVARDRVEIFPGIPDGWDFIAVQDTVLTTDAVTIHFPDRISDGLRLIRGRGIRLLQGRSHKRFYLTNTAQAGGQVTLFISGKGGAEFIGGQTVEVLNTVTVLQALTPTAVDGTVTVLFASSTLIRGINLTRTSLLIQNIGANRIYIGIDAGIASGGAVF